MSIKDPDHLLAEEAQDEERRKAVAAARDAPAQRLRRLYRAWHESPGHYTRGVANYSPEHYREELGVLPPTMRAFCLAWAPYLLRLAQTLTADGWWQDVERLCCRDPEDRGRLFTWHVLQAARAADHERVAELLERGNGLGDWFLQYGLYRELWTGAGTERVRPASPEPPAAMAPYSLKPPNWLVCAGKQVQVGVHAGVGGSADGRSPRRVDRRDLP